MGQRYGALQRIAGYYQLLGYVVAGITALVVLLILLTGAFVWSASGFFTRLIVCVVIAAIGGGITTTMHALSESIFLMVAIEENTRETARLLELQHRAIVAMGNSPTEAPIPSATRPQMRQAPSVAVGGSGQQNLGRRECPNCHEYVTGSPMYCPHCSHRLF